MPVDEIILNATDKMDKSVVTLIEHLAQIRTGRASTKLFEGIEIDAYGTLTPLSQMASITTPDASTVAIQPWDTSQLAAVEKAINAANLGFTPNNDGKIIRLGVPPLTEERRKEYVKQAHHVIEEGRVSIRNVRRHANDEIKKTEKHHDISEDDRDRALKEIQALTDEHVKKADTMLEKKEKEIMEV